jgi:hypothetical protein
MSNQGNATTLPAETLGDDILRGVKAIAAFTGEPERRVHYLLEKQLLPAGQMGRIWTASKRTLREHYARVTGAA